VIGGPHARAFPQDYLRFFDLVVGDSDEALVGDILDGVDDPARPGPVFSFRRLARSM